MKKRILTWTLMLAVSLSSFANNEESVSQKTLNSFKKEFSNAQDVKWETAKDYVKATFKQNDQVMFAYYSEAGELIAVTRNIVSSQLPIALLTTLKKNYNSYWISDLFEISSDNDASYYVTLQSADQTLVLKSNGISGWEVYKKEKKTAA